ncbi:hypothetical protein ON010_g10613 [Phytophthora cinnamomi]|nr:hypothetical protein ON010_g10613 [Phytophthora cinnamomi]
MKHQKRKVLWSPQQRASSFLNQRNLVITTGGGVQKARIARNLDDELTDVAEPGKIIPIRSITSEQQQQVNALLARWIARHVRPMIILEDEGFVEFVFLSLMSWVALILSCLTVPNYETTLSLLRYTTESVSRRTSQHFCAYYSLTSDVSTGRDGKSNISLTIHYITDYFESRNWTFEVRELPGVHIHDGLAIPTALNEMMQTGLLVKAYCTRLIRDGGSNMVSAAAKLGIADMSCIAHSLHLVVAGILMKKKTQKADKSVKHLAWAAQVTSECVESIPVHHEDEQLSKEEREDIEVLRDLALEEMDTYLDTTIWSLECNELDSERNVVQQFRALASYFRKSPKGQNRLSACQIKAHGIKPSEVLRVKIDCSTRWNNCWDMLQRLVAFEQSLVSFFAHLKSPEGRKEFEGVDAKLRRPKASEWLTIKCLSTLLAPLAAATAALSGQQYPTLPLVASTL